MSIPVVWDPNNQTGYYKSNGSKFGIYRPAYGFKLHLKRLLSTVIKQPQNFQKGTVNVYVTTSPVWHTYPFDTRKYVQEHNDTINARVIEEFKKYLDRQPNDNNFDFLARLSLKRDWAHECFLCLNDEQMGHICTCGCKEIVVFRPCGHSVCLRPCFTKFYNQPLSEKEIIEDGEVSVIIGRLNVNLDTNFECPMCRTHVTQTFASDDVECEGIDDFVEYLFDKLKDEMDIPFKINFN